MICLQGNFPQREELSILEDVSEESAPMVFSANYSLRNEGAVAGGEVRLRHSDVG
jgi:hypothetical protein